MFNAFSTLSPAARRAAIARQTPMGRKVVPTVAEMVVIALRPRGNDPKVLSQKTVNRLFGHLF